MSDDKWLVCDVLVLSQCVVRCVLGAVSDVREVGEERATHGCLRQNDIHSHT
jgi:hypothetical protein